MSGSPLVSVIIPTYNRWQYLQQTLESVLAQTYPTVEIIVVDDGSTDQTADMLAQYAEKITVIHQANQGGTNARNTGIQAAHGEYLSFLDHDDLLLPTKIERQVERFTSQPELGIVHCRWHFIGPDGQKLDKIGPLPEGDVFKQLVCGCFVWSGGPLIRRKCVDRVGSFDPAIWSSDWDMWLRIAQAGYRFGCVQEPLGCYRIMPDSTMADVQRTERMDVRLLDKVFEAPQLAPDIMAVKNEAYGIWRFWLSRRYYATGEGDHAARNLADALRLYPPLLENRAAFLDIICNEALDVRSSDPFKFVSLFFEHLPPEAESIRSEQAYVLSRVHAGAALRHYARGEINDAKKHLEKAVQLYPAMLTQQDEFAHDCTACAMRLPVTPLAYVKTVMENLPSVATALNHLRPKLLSDVAVAQGFEDYFQGHRGKAARQILTALRHRPTWVKNKGVLAVLAKSLPHILAE